MKEDVVGQNATVVITVEPMQTPVEHFVIVDVMVNSDGEEHFVNFDELGEENEVQGDKSEVNDVDHTAEENEDDDE